MRVYIETYGCSNNQSESEIMGGLLKQEGIELVDNIGSSNAIILNTCYVKSVTEQKIFFRLKEIQKNYPEKKLIVTGCIPSAAPERIEKVAPQASLISTHQITKVVPVLHKTLNGEKVKELGKDGNNKVNLPKHRINQVINIVSVGSGCSSSCSFCATKLAKGFISSYPKGKIVEDIRKSLNDGCKEIWLTGQDLGAYGLDRRNRDLPDLLNQISLIDGYFKVRVGMINPNHAIKILHPLIESYKSDKIYKFLHIPVQSGDNEVLDRMIRGYKVEDFEKVVEEFRKNYKVNIWTDIIVAFPGETEEQFENTIKLLEKTKPDWTNLSRYAKRPGTLASKFKQISTNIAKERSRIATNLINKISLEKNFDWIDWEGDVLISERGKRENQWIGRNFAYKPVLVESKENLLGKVINVKIVDAKSTYLLSSVNL